MALRPDPADEGLHDPGDEELWNESWYFDAVSDDGSLGVYVRLGRLVNQDTCLYTVCVTGPGRPSVMVVDSTAPLPDAGDPAQVVRTDALNAEHHCEVPLERWRLVVTAIGEAHADHSAPLRAEAGEPAAIDLDLIWETDGLPYKWKYGNRYEVPCRVSGTVRGGGETIEFSGPGQRDHSWGARDWWAVDWMWSAGRLDDGTRFHAVGLPGMPERGVGYVQSGGELTDLERVAAGEEVAADGLITDARIAMDPGGLAVDVEPLAFGAIRLDSPDGRLSHFPRAMCRFRTDDGRSGTGWVEWNRVQRA
jgi:hypothetical protein